MWPIIAKKKINLLYVTYYSNFNLQYIVLRCWCWIITMSRSSSSPKFGMSSIFFFEPKKPWLQMKGPCLVLVIEWQLRWTNKCLCWDTQVISPHKDTSMSNICHGGEMTKSWCYAHIVWWRNSLYMRHDME